MNWVQRNWMVCAGLAVWCGLAVGLSAAPDGAELADRVEAAYARHISDINRLTVVSKMEGGMVDGMEVVSRFRKTERDGRTVLEPVQDEDSEMVQWVGLHDGLLADMLRNARSITEAALEGAPVYVVLVDDQEYLKSLKDLQMGPHEGEVEMQPEQVTIQIGREDLTVRQMAVRAAGPGEARVNMVMDLSDYRVHNGLPVAHLMSISLSGMEQMIPAADLAQARQQIQQLQQQLAQMPEEQRAMVEALLAPQIREFESMMESGETAMRIRVVDVKLD